MSFKLVSICSNEPLVHFSLEELVLGAMQTRDHLSSELWHVESSPWFLISLRSGVIVLIGCILVLAGSWWSRSRAQLELLEN